MRGQAPLVTSCSASLLLFRLGIQKVVHHRDDDGSQIRQAAEVIVGSNIPVTQVTSFFDKAKHLAAIHKLPRPCWQAACEWLAAHDASVADVEGRVAQAHE